MRTKTSGAKSVPGRSSLNLEKGGVEAESADVGVDRDILSEPGLDITHSEKSLCIKCNKHEGQLLVCSIVDCPIAIHELCVGDPSFDENGNFYCPYCWYKLKIEQVEKTRNRMLISDKQLLEFLNYNAPQDDDEGKEEEGAVTSRKGISVSPTSLWEEESYTGCDEGEINEKGNLSKTRGLGVTVEEGAAGHDNETEKSMPSEKQQHQVHEIDQQAVNLPDKEESALNKRDTGSDISDSETETVTVYLTRSKSKGVQNVDSPNKLTSSNAKDGTEKCSASESPKLAEGDRSQNRGSRCSDADKGKKPKLVQESSEELEVFCSAKRKRLMWMSAEEEMLKEGVHKFSGGINKNMLWKQILEFGRHVFDPTRNPTDLKDKWRKMSSDSP